MGASHAIGHALGGTAGVAHGYTSCVMMPHVMRYNASVVREQQALIAQALGEPSVPAADQVARLITGLGLPGTLAAVGVTSEEQLVAVARAALEDPWLPTNPRPVQGVEGVLALLRAAMA